MKEYDLQLFQYISIRGVTRGAKGANFPGHCITMRARITAGSAERSQQCHIYFLQYSTFDSERPQVSTWGRETCFLSPAYNLVTPMISVQQVSSHKWRDAAL